ncbi:MAG: RluA family pseudouridine synthase [Alphaproteobacteria bacterium]|nr:RluA family pseudouridine synthase [Alphaproteobacteria bacterium]
MGGGQQVMRCDGGAQRLDRWLADQQGFGSRAKAKETILSGKVDVDGHTVGAAELGAALPDGAEVVVHWNRPGTRPATAKARDALGELGMRILYEDADVVVVDKPAGLLTDTVGAEQASRDSAAAQVGAWLRRLHQEAYVVHRIDRDTSGVVVFARTPAAHATLREAFATHVPERTYWAAVQGVPAPEGTWVHPMKWDHEALRQRIVPPDTEGAVEARASWTVREAFDDAAILEVRLDTGRRNQIRVHLQAVGHPLLGETQYLVRGQRPRHARRDVERQALHAWKLTFPHPADGRPIRVEAPLPEELARLTRRLRTKR